MKKFPYLIFGTVLLVLASSVLGKSIIKDENNDLIEDEAILDNGSTQRKNDTTGAGVPKPKTTIASETDSKMKTIKIKPLTTEELDALFDQADSMSKKAKVARWGQDDSLKWNADLFQNSYDKPIVPSKPDVTFQTFDEIKARQDSIDSIMKSLKEMDDNKINLDTLSSNNYNWNDYKSPEYTSTYSYSGVNGYHISGGFMVVALVLVFIRCCLICCRYQVQNENRARSIILVRETPVHALIISRRHRSNSKDDLMENAELPGDDPPTYEDCTREPTTANTGALPDYVHPPPHPPPPFEDTRNEE
jgi:hypothetical protein